MALTILKLMYKVKCSLYLYNAKNFLLYPDVGHYNHDKKKNMISLCK